MNRESFNAAYRAARTSLRIFTNTALPQDERAKAELEWQLGVKRWPLAYIACSKGLLPAEGQAYLSNGALYAYRHGFYYTDRTSWQGWVKEALSIRQAA